MGAPAPLCPTSAARLPPPQTESLAADGETGGVVGRAYQLKVALRAVFAGDLSPETVMNLIERWCSRAQRSQIPDFVRVAATIRKNKDGIAAAVNRGLANGRHEGLNNRIRTMTRRSYGFHSPEAALALIMLAGGTHNLQLPYPTLTHPPSITHSQKKGG